MMKTDRREKEGMGGSRSKSYGEKKVNVGVILSVRTLSFGVFETQPNLFRQENNKNITSLNPFTRMVTI